MLIVATKALLWRLTEHFVDMNYCDVWRGQEDRYTMVCGLLMTIAILYANDM